MIGKLFPWWLQIEPNSLRAMGTQTHHSYYELL